MNDSITISARITDLETAILAIEQLTEGLLPVFDSSVKGLLSHDEGQREPRAYYWAAHNYDLLAGTVGLINAVTSILSDGIVEGDIVIQQGPTRDTTSPRLEEVS